MSNYFLRIKYTIVLLVLMILDIAPVPIIGLIALSILFSRPKWFKEFVDRLYSDQ